MKWLKKFLATLALAGLFALPAVAAPPSDPNLTHVALDGKLLTFDVPGRGINGRTFVPLRGIAEALGAKVDYDQKTQTVTITKGTDVMKLTFGSKVVEWRGSILVMDVEPVVIDNRTLVPLRFLGQAMGVAVGWDGGTRTARLETRPADEALALGTKLVYEKSCMVCHTIGGVGGNVGPNLDGVTARHTEEWLREWLRDPQAIRKGSRMPNFKFTEEEIEGVITFLDQL